MAIKQLWSNIFKGKNTSCQNNVDSEGFLNDNGNLQVEVKKNTDGRKISKEILVKKFPAIGKERPMELVQQGLVDMVEQLKGINNHLSKQVTQHEELMGRIEDLPDMIQSLPDAVKNQSDSVNALLEQLKSESKRNENFIETIDKIPTETGKNTDALQNISQQLSASAETDVQFIETFNSFRASLENLNKTTTTQTDSIKQMNKTFTASDRYMKYLVSKQNKRLMWTFIVAISISGLAIISLLAGLAIVLSK